MKSGKILLGVLAGVAAGATLGILFAPEKGSRTRRKILNKGDDYADEMKEKLGDLIDTINNKFANSREEAEELVSKGKSKYDELKKEVKHVASEKNHTTE